MGRAIADVQRDTALKNAETGIIIGYMRHKGEPMLYVEREGVRTFYARFTCRQRAEEFLEVLKEYDMGGGNDGYL